MMMTSKYVVVNDREVHYTEWGPGDAPALVMWHGLTRTGRDFDEIALVMSKHYRVLCPDTIGRGLSQWAKEPEEYATQNLCALAAAFVNAVCGATAVVDWLGTSMGGLLAMFLAAKGGLLENRIRNLLLNDIGPELNPVALAAISQYATKTVVVDRVSELAAMYKALYEPNIGPQAAGYFERIAEGTYRRLDDGRFTQHYDPRCVKFVNGLADPTSVWQLYDATTAVSILAVRGGASQLLLEDAHKRMGQREGMTAKVRLATVPGVGHTPVFTTPDQVDLVASFFQQPEASP